MANFKQILKAHWLAGVLGTVIYLGTTVALLRSPKGVTGGTPADSGPVENAAEPVPSWAFHNPEIEQLVADLKKEKAALAAREKTVNETSARVEAEKLELAQVIQAVQRVQREFDKNVTNVQESEAANLKKLGKTYAAMTPEGASVILSKMEDDAIVKILVFMKDSETAPILETMSKRGEDDAKRAAAISERLRLSVSKPAGKAKK